MTGWIYDIAREQSPSEDRLRELFLRSQDAGYGAIGLYLEHRYAYPSAPWAAAPGSLTPELINRLQSDPELSKLRVVPFLNTLGHMEGFIRTEGGEWLAEGPGQGFLQLCPSRKECADFAWGLVSDAMEAFDDEWIHLGGDEAQQLGQCHYCAERVQSIGVAGLYGEYYGQMCQRVLNCGRRPCLWGDMLTKFPEALKAIPKETVIFDWNYFDSPSKTTRMLRAQGFDVVCCPALRTYDAAWCFLDETCKTVDAHVEEAQHSGALGVWICAWEFFGFSSFLSVSPLIFAIGRHIKNGEEWDVAIRSAGGKGYLHAAEVLGKQFPSVSAFLSPGTWRSLRESFVLNGNPFHLWSAWRSDACGSVGDTVLRSCDNAEHLLPKNSPLCFPIELHRVAVRWVRLVEEAYQVYSLGNLEACITLLRDGSLLLDRMRPGLEHIVSAGGSRADLKRLDRLVMYIADVISRLENLEKDSSWRPAFETLVDKTYLPGDQAAWKSGSNFH